MRPARGGLADEPARIGLGQLMIREESFPDRRRDGLTLRTARPSARSSWPSNRLGSMVEDARRGGWSGTGDHFGQAPVLKRAALISP